MTPNNDTRFFRRDAFLIGDECLIAVMRELLDDKTLSIDQDYPVLSLLSQDRDVAYEADEILEIIGDHIGRELAEVCYIKDIGEVYFISKDAEGASIGDCDGCENEAAARDQDCCWNCIRNRRNRRRDLYRRTSGESTR